MISWIVATHDRRILLSTLLPSLNVDPFGDELIVTRDAPSITVAYAEGQEKATQPVRCYVHHDVRILDLPRLRQRLIDGTAAGWGSYAMGGSLVTQWVRPGIVGVIGSVDRAFPWWDGTKLGSVVDTRPAFGRLDFGPGGPCSMLDGLLLATRQHVDWDIKAPGWHGYDHDACAQMLHRGHDNWCLTGGAELVEHRTTGPTHVPGLAPALARVKERWE